jgi:glutathione synthase/RimK-type ligase-like ATP-grasp enzyme
MTKSGLERIAIKLFSKTTSISVSPLMEFTGEYRCIVLDNTVKVIYEKNRQNVVGNGKSTLKELICEKYNDIDLKQIILNMDRKNAELLNEIIEEDKIIVLNWKHNLGLGAEPEIIISGDKYEKIKDLALKASKELNIGFASIDIVEHKNKLYILEINSGVMMERFAITNENGYEIAKGIYKEAIKKMFI